MRARARVSERAGARAAARLLLRALLLGAVEQEAALGLLAQQRRLLGGARLLPALIEGPRRALLGACLHLPQPSLVLRTLLRKALGEAALLRLLCALLGLLAPLLQLRHLRALRRASVAQRRELPLQPQHLALQRLQAALLQRVRLPQVAGGDPLTRALVEPQLDRLLSRGEKLREPLDLRLRLLQLRLLAARRDEQLVVTLVSAKQLLHAGLQTARE